MADREKVIKGLECIAQKQAPTANPCKDCGYIDRPNYSICVKDIAVDALELLKEQEPVKPDYSPYYQQWYCGNCGKMIPRAYDYCNYCGRAVKWE